MRNMPWENRWIAIRGVRNVRCDRGHFGDQRLTPGQRVMRESLGLENLLALEQALRIGSEALDEVLARRQLIEASA